MRELKRLRDISHVISLSRRLRGNVAGSANSALQHKFDASPVDKYGCKRVSRGRKEQFRKKRLWPGVVNNVEDMGLSEGEYGE